MELTDNMRIRKDLLELAEYVGKDPVEVQKIVFDEKLFPGTSEDWVLDEWRSKERESEADILDFYRTSKGMLFHPTWWTAHNKPDSEYHRIVKYCRDHDVKYVLDFGGGNGETIIRLSEVCDKFVYVDMGPVMDFAEWRFKRRKMDVRVIDGSGPYRICKKFDGVVCCDVLEHVKDPFSLWEDLIHWLKIDGLFFLRIGWKTDTPLHLWDHDFLMDKLDFSKFEFIAEEDNLSIWRRRVRLVDHREKI